MTEDQLLGPHGREREDESVDTRFYQEPRLVAHLDDAAIATVTALYRPLLAPLAGQGRVLDLMSSRYAHLPDDVPRGAVVGLGMNRAELDANPQLTERVVHDLNTDPHLPFADASFDVALNTVSVQYLSHPLAVFREVARVLRPGGAYAVVFSNRMFPTKAIRAWRERDDAGHIALVRAYFALAGGFAAPEVTSRPGTPGFWFTPGGDPVYAVVARRAPVCGRPIAPR
ncbi:MAG TPA: methyltransferase domain-containing protein [Ktedonobacterales bacterium]|nr:methyltransferase domain-containing protein [Ktedonobacterales bacterium]